MAFQRITSNIGGPKKRYELLDGKQHLVIPAVMLTVGVHNGSDGPLLYTPEDMSKNPTVWNHKPVVVQHPTLNGEGISACDPSVVDRQRVGMMFSTSWDGRLRTETWLDEEKLKKTAPAVLDAINGGRMVEVSTGLFYDLEVKEGTHNGEAYKGIVRNIQPDHLAILPNETGACSIADGAGLLRNADGGELSYSDVREHAHQQMRSELPKDSYSFPYVTDVFPKYVVYEQEGRYYKRGYKVKDGTIKMDADPEEVRRVTSYVTMNDRRPVANQEGGVSFVVPERSDWKERQRIVTALVANFGNGWAGRTEDFDSGGVVYSEGDRLFRLSFVRNEDKISFIGGPEEVERANYRPKGSNMTTPSNTTQQKPAANMTTPGAVMTQASRQDRVNSLITAGKAQEVDRPYLEGLADSDFEQVHTFAMRSLTAETIKPIVPAVPIVPISQTAPAPSLNQSYTPQQLDAYINQQPPPIQRMIRNAMAAEVQEKTQLIKTILSNQGNVFAEQYLSSKDVPELRGLASLCSVTAQAAPLGNYGGQADIPMFNQNSPVYAQNHAQVEALPLPVMNFEKKS